MTDSTPFACGIEVRFNDIDAMGHVNNAIIFTYFEEGRKKLLYETLKETIPDGFSFIIAHLECDYVRPVRLDDKLRLSIQVAAMGTKSFTFAYTLADETDPGWIFAKGSSVQVWYDYNQRKSIPVPATVKKALSAYWESA
jgi:acyl-CoA thioester hydrolase